MSSFGASDTINGSGEWCSPGVRFNIWFREMVLTWVSFDIFFRGVKRVFTVLTIPRPLVTCDLNTNLCIMIGLDRTLKHAILWIIIIMSVICMRFLLFQKQPVAYRTIYIPIGHHHWQLLLISWCPVALSFITLRNDVIIYDVLWWCHSSRHVMMSSWCPLVVLFTMSSGDVVMVLMISLVICRLAFG